MPTIEDSWSRICDWMNTHAPGSLDDAGSPATKRKLNTAAKKMNVQLHADHAEFCQVVDGAESSGVFPACGEWEDMAFSPMSLEESVSEWEMLKDLLEMGEFDGLSPKTSPGISDVWWNTLWIPFASNGGGDYYCIDLAPENGGKLGQIIFHSHESGEHVVLAESLRSYLAKLADDLEAGKFEYDEDYGIKTPDEDE